MAEQLMHVLMRRRLKFKSRIGQMLHNIANSLSLL